LCSFKLLSCPEVFSSISSISSIELCVFLYFHIDANKIFLIEVDFIKKPGGGGRGGMVYLRFLPLINYWPFSFKIIDRISQANQVQGIQNFKY
jgi:hypothetical protein